MSENRPYEPSNGTEGEAFMERFCYRCQGDAKYQQTWDGEDGCQILVRSMVYRKSDPLYPKEWVTDGTWKGTRCTAFEPCTLDGEVKT